MLHLLKMVYNPFPVLQKRYNRFPTLPANQVKIRIWKQTHRAITVMVVTVHLIIPIINTPHMEVTLMEAIITQTIIHTIHTIVHMAIETITIQVCLPTRIYPMNLEMKFVFSLAERYFDRKFDISMEYHIIISFRAELISIIWILMLLTCSKNNFFHIVPLQATTFIIHIEDLLEVITID